MAQRIDIADGSMFGLAATLAFLGGTAAEAETATSGLGVTATILPNCSISLNPVAFGALDLPIEGAVDAAGTLTVNCTQGTRWSAAADRGNGQGASLTSRKMSSGSGGLAYNLYLDSGRSRVWADGNNATGIFSDMGSGVQQGFPIYGRIAAGQEDAAPGSYADVVVVTVTY